VSADSDAYRWSRNGERQGREPGAPNKPGTRGHGGPWTREPARPRAERASIRDRDRDGEGGGGPLALAETGDGDQAKVVCRPPGSPSRRAGGSAHRAIWRINDFGGCQTPRSSNDHA
jgi:hypothetical protein